MKAKLEIESDEPVLVLVIPLGRRTPSVKPATQVQRGTQAGRCDPRKCSGERKLVVVTGESLGELVPFERRRTA